MFEQERIQLERAKDTYLGSVRSIESAVRAVVSRDPEAEGAANELRADFVVIPEQSCGAIPTIEGEASAVAATAIEELKAEIESLRRDAEVLVALNADLHKANDALTLEVGKLMLAPAAGANAAAEAQETKVGGTE